VAIELVQTHCRRSPKISLVQQLKAVNRLLLGTCDTAQPIMMSQAVKA